MGPSRTVLDLEDSSKTKKSWPWLQRGLVLALKTTGFSLGLNALVFCRFNECALCNETETLLTLWFDCYNLVLIYLVTNLKHKSCVCLHIFIVHHTVWSKLSWLFMRSIKLS